MKVKSRLMAALGSLKEQPSGGSAAAAATVLSTIETAILRSTEDAPSAPDDKYVHEILFEISNAPGAITHLARRLTARLASGRSAVVALKALLLLHRLLRGGDRYFEQDLRGLWASGDLRISLKWMAAAGDPDPLCSFVLCYSRFLEERMDWVINQAGNLEPNRTSYPCFFREDKAESTLYRLSKCQAFLDRIMECPPVSSYATTTTMTTIHLSAMSIMLRESFRVYGSFCDGMDTVVSSSSFRELKKPTRLLAVDVLRKACGQASGLRDYYDECKKFLAGRGFDYPAVRVYAAADFSWTESSSSTPSSRGGEEEGGGGGGDEEGGDDGRKGPFSGGMETRISTVWVDFDDGEGAAASGGGSGAGDGGAAVEGKGMELL